MLGLSKTATARAAIAVAIAGCATSASAASYVATNSNFKSIFAGAAAGDTIVLRGKFSTTVMSNRSFATPLKIDARAAQFNGALIIRDIQGLSVSGGIYGSTASTYQNGGTIRVENSNTISFTQPKLFGDGLGKARGLTFLGTDNFSVNGGSFTGFRLALGVNDGNRGTLVNNKITKSTSDGMNIVDSHFITARGNTCSGTVPSAGAHPDCIQLWSIAGNPVQSDIQLIDNTALGRTQGFTSFDPARGGGLRITMIGNRVDTSMPQGIACYNCVDSLFADNVLTTLPGSRFKTNMNIVGGSNNTLRNNSIQPYKTRPAGLVGDDALVDDGSSSALLRMAPAGFGSGADVFDQFEAIEGDWGSAAALAGVPEPGVWAQLIGGFAFVGGLLRMRRGRRVAGGTLARA